ncbi:PAAR motif of membran proteins [Pseudomonas phage PspYZU05]|uniref:Phospholipase n=1 Tax=Pseudomonas phage PspYZU05 TaxID=1983556 RepID=A0A2U7N2L4_9CAUD|nr:PAAR motif of membran proteins [Pseudomonas phage PspYZU05]ASD52065.1 hypothetical protein PspYZU05_113 [Pseudomonas phage PspYZU05]
MSYDKCVTSGHDAFPPTIVNGTQGKVFVQNIKALVEGDAITPHTRTVKPFDTHGGSVQPRTNKVFIGGKKAVQIGDPISCGDTVAKSSNKVFIK